MGQRSQIFIRYNKKLIVANYYQWNFGERMISRARTIIEYIKRNLDYTWYFEDKFNIETLKRYCDVNFDFKDIVRSSDIFKEWKEEFKDYQPNFNVFAFEQQDNNDGKLLIDIDTQTKTIKYCLLDRDNELILNAEDYLKWDHCYNKKYKCVKWESHYDNECIEYTKNNIKVINENAQLMTRSEVEDYISQKYEVE